MDDATPTEKPPELALDTRGRQSGVRIAVLLLAAAAVLGVLVFRNLVVSESYLRGVWHEIGERGATLSVEGCVDEVIRFSDECEAIKGLCDVTVTGMMARCLGSGDRVAYCEDVGNRTRDTRFGVAECSARQLPSRHERTVCAASYRAIDGHCRQLQRDEVL